MWEKKYFWNDYIMFLFHSYYVTHIDSKKKKFFDDNFRVDLYDNW